MGAPPASVSYVGLPVLYDLADGVTLYPKAGGIGTQTVGTANPTGAVQVSAKGYNGTVVWNVGNSTGIQVEELPDSPELERAEQATCTKRFRMPYIQAQGFLAGLGRGTILQDNESNQIRVLSASVKREKPNMAILTIVAEGLSFDTPPDEFECQTVDLGIDILKHPRYFYALMPNPAVDSVPVQQVKQAIIRAIQAYRDSPTVPPNATTLGAILNMGDIHLTISSGFTLGKFNYNIPNPNFNSSFPPNPITDLTINDAPAKATSTAMPNPQNLTVSFDQTVNDPTGSVAMALAAAQEIVQKLWRMEDNPPVVGVQITHSVFYYRPDGGTAVKGLNPGSYVEDPITQGNLPDYFYSTDSPPTTNPNTTIFAGMYQINPQCYSSNGKVVGGSTNISWLRKSDNIQYERTWFKITRTWIGGAIGQWDQDIFQGYGGIPSVGTRHSGRPQVPSDYTVLQ